MRFALSSQKISMHKQDLTGIRCLLFDLGGVIMDIRRENCVEALTRLGMKGADELLGLYCQSGPFLQLEEGKISPADFRNEIRRRTDGNPSDADIDRAFNAFLTGIPVHRLRSLEQLRKDYRVYLLSNTNDIMFRSKIAEEFRKDGKECGDYFDGICLSYEERLVKPDVRIFRRVAEKFGITPEETLFFDDSEKNIASASAAGFRTCLVEPSAEFMDCI